MAPIISFSGLASGIDSKSLIQAILDQQRTARRDPLVQQKADREDTNSALSELKTKLAALQSTLRDFSSLSGGAVSKQATSSDETKLSATASNAAVNGSYTVTTTQLAQSETYSFQSTAGTYSSSTAAVASGINNADPAVNRTLSFSIGTSSPETVDVEITSSTTLEDVANQINSSSDRAQASVVNVGSSATPDYRLLVTSTTEGTEEGAITVTVGSSITGQNAFNNNTENNATDAQFTISGIGGTITRSSNTISDLITGVSFSLGATGSASVSIGSDVETTKAKVSDFVDQFNEIVSFINDNNLVSVEQASGGGTEAVFGVLKSTNVDESVLNSIRSAISGSGYSGGSSVSVFSDLGITTQRDGTLAFDESVFESAVSDEPDSVNQILKTFSDTASLTGGTIDNYIRFNGLFDVTTNNNSEQIKTLDDKIARVEEELVRQEERLRIQYSHLESVIGGLQSQQSTLSSALSGL